MSKITQIFPEWLTQDYIQKCLQSKFKDTSLRISKFKCQAATVNGENHASAMMRISVEYRTKSSPETQKSSYILKTSCQQFPNSEPIAAIEPYDVYNKEILLYGTIFPQFNDLLTSAGFQERLTAECISIDQSRDMMLLEDLRERNFVIGQRTVGLNFEHAQLALRKLARIHAASAILNEQSSPGIFEGFDLGTFTKHTKSMAAFYESYVETCGEVASAWPGFEKYGAKLLAMKAKIMNYGIRNYEPRKDRLNVLVHGDLWTNNIMFQYTESGELVDAILIDFQFICWSSPCIDLHHFLRTSLVEEIGEDDINVLVEMYYADLVDGLQRMGFKGHIPTLEEFWEDYADTEMGAVIATCVNHPFMVNESKEDVNPFHLLGDDERSKEYRRKVFSNKKVERALKKLLPGFDERGLMD